MGYYINLENISIDEYKEILKGADLLPSRMILKNDIDEKFAALKELQIENVEVLRKTLSNKSKLQAISKQTGITEEYLKILIREVRSYRQKPNRIQDFPGVSMSAVHELDKLGIRNTLQLFDFVLTPESRRAISKQTGINESEIIRLAQLTDLSRIRWVNHTFAYVLLEAGYDSSEKVAGADYKDLYERVCRLNEEREIYKGHIGLHDMKLCVEAAKDVSLDFEY
jgi:hypothetical protein